MTFDFRFCLLHQILCKRNFSFQTRVPIESIGRQENVDSVFSEKKTSRNQHKWIDVWSRLDAGPSLFMNESLLAHMVYGVRDGRQQTNTRTRDTNNTQHSPDPESGRMRCWRTTFLRAKN